MQEQTGNRDDRTVCQWKEFFFLSFLFMGMGTLGGGGGGVENGKVDGQDEDLKKKPQKKNQVE